MHRLAAQMLCAFVAGGLLAAPAPFPRPGQTGPWFDGWDRPADPLGDCRFDRHGDRLTITVPGKGHEKDPLDTPRLLRDVEGDFAAEVRVGPVRLPDGRTGSQSLGLLLPLGRGFVTLQRVALRNDDEATTFFLVGVSYPSIAERSLGRYRGCWPPEQGPAYLRLERRGDWLTLLVSEDGKAWKQAANPFRFRGFRVPRRLKVGVVADASAKATFRTVFDQFRIAPLREGGRPGDAGRCGGFATGARPCGNW